jgi:hypothetical protein
MRSKLSYYSVLLLAGLVAGSALLIAINPFNGTPASAAPGVATSSTSSQAGQPSGSGFAPPSQPGGVGSQPEGTFGSHHHGDDDGGYSGGPPTGNNTVTTTTTSAASIYSQDE